MLTHPPHTLYTHPLHTLCREPPGSALSRMKEKMVKWLKGLADREEVREEVREGGSEGEY